jgi:diaminopimelate epimerase
MRQAFWDWWRWTYSIGNDTIASNLETATDFKMVYYNSDGNQLDVVTADGVCGFQKLQLIKNKTTFIAT